MKNFTHTTIVLDESDNMAEIKQNAIDTYNAYVKKQCPNLIATFNSKVVFRVDPATQTLNDTNYIPSGDSAVYDAIGKTINVLGLKFTSMPEWERPNTVIVAILTTGIDNSSGKYSRTIVEKMIKHQKEKYNWKFIFLKDTL